MFPRRKRLSRDAFPLLLRSGRRVTSSLFTVVYSHQIPGYAVVVPKKLARLSVMRHKIRRRISAALRGMSLPNGLIVFPKTTLNDVQYKDIVSDLETLIKKATA